jgi:SAM-dependent methyltransferase
MRRVIAREMLDDLEVDDAELAANFDDIERANRYFGGLAPTVAGVLGCGARTVLDVGCGSADVDRALSAAARRRSIPMAIVALDLSPRIVALARARSVSVPEIEFAVGDGTALPYADGAFDVAMCNLALHHFEPQAAVRMLGELRRVSRITPLVSDLARSRFGYVAALAFAGAIARNRCAKKDGPLSVLRAYDRAEILDLTMRAGWRAPHVRNTPFFRHLITDRG